MLFKICQIWNRKSDPRKSKNEKFIQFEKKFKRGAEGAVETTPSAAIP
tara:strand:- start:1565 stop:1708 length:144 start_codon:yes stop_codon:yes gene_type:complete